MKKSFILISKMHKTNRIVINTGPLLAIVAATGELKILQSLYKQVIVLFEVCQEILTGGKTGFATTEFQDAEWLDKQEERTKISPFLLNVLDVGEASVIHTAIDYNLQTVCIDERAGRRIARLSSLQLTGSIGILLRAIDENYPINIHTTLERMKKKGIHVSDSIINYAISSVKSNES